MIQTDGFCQPRQPIMTPKPISPVYKEWPAKDPVFIGLSEARDSRLGIPLVMDRAQQRCTIESYLVRDPRQDDRICHVVSARETMSKHLLVITALASVLTRKEKA
jgi:hypothetical protein